MKTIAWAWCGGVGSLLLLLLVLVVPDPEEPAGESGAPMLSVRESLVPLFSIHDLPRKAGHPYSVLTFPYDRLNPDIRRYVMASLQEELVSQSNCPSSGGVFLLGAVCTAEDMAWMASYMESFMRKVGDCKETRLQGYGFAGQAGILFGMALARHPEAAQELVAKYSSVSAWAPLGVEKLPPTNLSPVQVACGQFILFAYCYSKSEYLRALLHDQLEDPDKSLGVGIGMLRYVEGREKSGYASYSEPRHVPRKEQDRAVERCVKLYGKQIDALMLRVDNPLAGTIYRSW